MNLDVLDFEWFIAPHDAIEGYFEQIKVNHPDGNGYIIPISNLPFLPSNGLTFDFYNYTYSEQFTGEVVDCGINEITIKVQGELFTLKKQRF